MAKKIINKLVIFIMIVVLFNTVIVPNVYADNDFWGNVKNDMKESTNAKEKGTIDEIMGGAQGFIKEGESNTISHKNEVTGKEEEQFYGTINEEYLGKTADFLYNLLLGLGIIVAVIVGVLLGIKYMMGSVEEKAEYKQSLYGYAIGCAVVFGAFGIWKLAINILNTF